MKVLYTLTILAALVFTPGAFGGIGDLIESKLIQIRDQMPNGFPKLGIPPLAPLKIAQQAIIYNEHDIAADVKLQDLSVLGLNGFDILKTKLNIFSSKVELILNFANVSVNTQYALKGKGQKGGLIVDLIGDGPASVSVTDIYVKVNAKYSMGLTGGKVALKKLAIDMNMGGINSNINGILGHGELNNNFNAFINSNLVSIVNDNIDSFSGVLADKLLLLINDFLASKFENERQLQEVFDDL